MAVKKRAMNDEQVRPEQYEAIVRMLPSQIFSLLQDNGFIVPVEVSLIDAQGVVAWLRMDSYGDVRSLLDTSPSLPLRARLPIDVAVTDIVGSTWNASISAEDLPRVQR